MVETEAIAATFTFASFDSLSTAFVDLLYHNLKIMRKVINNQAQMVAFNGNLNKRQLIYLMTIP